MLDEVGQGIMKAADIMVQRGMAKGVLQDPMGQVCIKGALGIAFANDPYTSGVWAIIAQREDRLPPTGQAVIRLWKALGEDPASWNNREEVTQDMVVAKLREVANDPQYAVTAN